MFDDNPGSPWSDGRRAIGANQTIKLIRTKKAKIIYLAKDADHAFKTKILSEISRHGTVPVNAAYSSEELGKQNGIDVACAVVAFY